MTTLQCLRKSRERIAHKGDWVKDAFAVDAEDCSCESRDSQAVAWCALGAMEWTKGDVDQAACELAQHLADPPVHGAGDAIDLIASWNDSVMTTHADVLTAFDAAILRLQYEEARLTSGC